MKFAGQTPRSLLTLSRRRAVDTFQQQCRSLQQRLTSSHCHCLTKLLLIIGDCFCTHLSSPHTQQGMRLYPSGYFPKELAIFYNYRNRDCIFAHKCRNIALIGGIYGDSRVQIDIDRADDILIQDLTVVGTSDAYYSVMETQSAPSVCDLYGHLNRGRSNTGIQLHTFVNEVEGSGAVIKNVTFAGFWCERL